ncbi:MAG: AmmeMemoRadiSam system radical SAM enzyme [Chloroflexi bacterium]|nr:AmmeMemoRadiSam system radical SAM enzyme [Chloroflexota bacterium]
MNGITRRQFLLGAGALTACGVGTAASLSGSSWWERPPRGTEHVAPTEPPNAWSVEARYYASFAGEGAINCADCHGTSEEPLPVSYCHTPHTGAYVQCNLCPHNCIIADGERGTCRVRENRGGRLYSMVYGNPCARHVDPIEKKPFYHFLPTVASFSIATAGCSLRCAYCQNWQISQLEPEETRNVDMPPEDVVAYAQQQGAPVIAYTYSEPMVFYEYMLDTARLARDAGLRNVVISAGFINPEPLRDLCQVVDAIKIDLKGYDENFYRDVCEAELGPVLEAIRTIYESGTHLEIVNLVVPTLNDSLEQLRALSRWVAQDLSPDVPIHFSRFHPDYKLTNLPPTPEETLDQARDIALEEGVRFAYVGNVPGHSGNHTYCPACGETIVAREGFSVVEYNIQAGACAYCGEPISGIWWSGDPEGEPIHVAPVPPDQ